MEHKLLIRDFEVTLRTLGQDPLRDLRPRAWQTQCTFTGITVTMHRHAGGDITGADYVSVIAYLKSEGHLPPDWGNSK